VKRKHAMCQVQYSLVPRPSVRKEEGLGTRLSTVLNADSGVFIEAAVRLSEGEYYNTV